MSLGSRLQARLEEQLRELRQENDALRGQQAHFNPEFLKKQAADILRFYAPICVDHENGGFFNQILDDGSVYDAVTKHVVGTCRYTVNFSMAHRLFPESSHDYKELCERGVSYLIDSHWDKEHGGMCWVLGADGTVIDGAKYMYSNAFALLALSESLKIRVGNSKAVEEHIEKIWQVCEEHFWEPTHELYKDHYTTRDWSNCSSYRGQNPNMHMCEALLVFCLK